MIKERLIAVCRSSKSPSALSSTNLRVFGKAFIKMLNWKIMTLWSVKTPYLLETISVGYSDKVRHARDYKVKYVVATSAFLTELCQEVVLKSFNKG